MGRRGMVNDKGVGKKWAALGENIDLSWARNIFNLVIINQLILAKV